MFIRKKINPVWLLTLLVLLQGGAIAADFCSGYVSCESRPTDSDCNCLSSSYTATENCIVYFWYDTKPICQRLVRINSLTFQTSSANLNASFPSLQYVGTLTIQDYSSSSGTVNLTNAFPVLKTVSTSLSIKMNYLQALSNAFPALSRLDVASFSAWLSSWAMCVHAAPFPACHLLRWFCVPHSCTAPYAALLRL